ncbi:LamG-like jellyroll fold domain-containing protein [Marinobacter sp. M1N3S26]|uniref:LamG-like jellyroll fold domain-containing protein n=1 Tax=Marinobacter sp. M1N3S26 TaxID=3382299 RepID=UPI00387B340E
MQYLKLPPGNTFTRLLLLLVLTFSLLGCNSDSSDGGDSSNPVNDGDDGSPDNNGDSDSPGDNDGTNEQPVNSFTLAILPDTQKYSRYSPERFDAQTQWIADNYVEEKIPFTLHLGDVVDIATQDYEWTNAMQALSILNQNSETPYSVLAGNHDVLQSWQYDTERDQTAEPYLDHFSADLQASRFLTFQGTDPTGFNSYHIFHGEVRDYLVLATDWRTSFASIDWLQSVLDKHPDMPAILTTHELLNTTKDKTSEHGAMFTDHGRRLWSNLIYNNDQIFLTINGHHHGEGTMIAKNQYGNDVIMQVVDYQSGFWGGNGMMQLITFDLPNKMLRFRSFSPWVANIPQAQRGPQDELERWEHTIPMDFEERFSNFNEDPVANQGSPGNIEGTLAYWVLDEAHRVTGSNGAPGFIDASGNGNSMTLTAQQNPSQPLSEYFRVTPEHPPFGHSTGSAHFDPIGESEGYYLRSEAPGLTFQEALSGELGYLPEYTIEAIVRLPEDWDADTYAWTGILNHRRSITDICNFHKLSCSGDDPSVGLNVSSLTEFQWITVSQNGKQPDSWSWEVQPGQWYHVAMVNDGERLLMYVNGQQVMRSGSAVKQGLLAAPGRPWAIGTAGDDYDTVSTSLFSGFISEIRINNRALEQSEWLYNQ